MRLMTDLAPIVKSTPNAEYLQLTLAGLRFSMNKVEAIDLAEQLLKAAELLQVSLPKRLQGKG